MQYNVISADCHIDLIWLPPELFTSNATSEMKARMPFVTDSEKGPLWVSKHGAIFGLQNGMGSAGREYVPGEIYRSDRMAEQGLYEDGRNGIRRLTEPDLRVKDQDLDGIQAEVLYGILGAAERLQDPPAAAQMMRIYNDWLTGFCDSHRERFAGIASIPDHDIAEAAREIYRVAEGGVLRGVEIALRTEMKPLFDEMWRPVWRAAEECGLPIHFHTIGGKKPDFETMPAQQQRPSFAVFITGFQLKMADKLMEIIYGGILEAYPKLQVVIGESGIGWIPYLLEHMDLEWEEQFRDLTLTMKPSDYWHRQCYATYQSDPVGLRLLDMLGENNVMWGSDFPHPDGVWPDSQQFIARETSELSDELRKKVVCDNAARLYGFAD